MTRSKIGICALFALTTALAGCIGEYSRKPYDPSRARGTAELDRTRPGVSDEAVDAFGFAVYWDTYIRDEVITGVYMAGQVLRGEGEPQLYAFTASKRLYQIDLHSGNVNWVFDVGEPLSFTEAGRPIAEWVYRRDERRATGLNLYDEIYFVAKDTLFALDKANGSELWRMELPFNPSCAPEASSTHVYVGSWDDRVYAIRKDRHILPDWSWRTDGDILARPAVASPAVFVASTDGDLYTFEAATGDPKEPFKTQRRLKVDPIVYRSLLYVSSDDYNLYVLNADDGRVVDRFGAGAPVVRAPVGIMNPREEGQGFNSNIYFVAEGKGLYALHRKPRAPGKRQVPHDMVWVRKDASQVLCRGSSDVYLLEPSEDDPRARRITRIDAMDGHFRDALEVSDVSYFVTNPNSPHATFREESLVGGMVVLGYKNGWILALKEKATMPGGVVGQSEGSK